MKLYTNGCSFTHGHKNFVNDPVLYKNYVQRTETAHFSWPWHLKQNFDIVINDAKQGTGAQRLTRSTLQFIYQILEEIDEWIFILQFSQANRTEVYVDLIEAWLTVDWSDLSLKHNTLEKRNRISHEKTTTNASQSYIEELLCNHQFTNSIYDHRVFTFGDNYDFYLQAKEILLLINFMKSSNIKYLVTGMDDYNYQPQEMIKYVTSNETKALINLIDDTNFIKAMPEIIPFKGNEHLHDKCGHLNEKGHEVFAAYIKEELEKRKWSN